MEPKPSGSRDARIKIVTRKKAAMSLLTTAFRIAVVCGRAAKR